jgi:hypothetical protein
VPSPDPSSSAMDLPRQPAFSIRCGQGKEDPFSEKYVQQTASAQTRYVTVLSPKSAMNAAEEDARAIPGQATLSHHDAQGNDAALPRRLFERTPPQSSRYVRMLLQLDQIHVYTTFSPVYSRGSFSLGISSSRLPSCLFASPT